MVSPKGWDAAESGRLHRVHCLGCGECWFGAARPSSMANITRAGSVNGNRDDRGLTGVTEGHSLVEHMEQECTAGCAWEC